MYYLKRFYQSFKIHQFKVQATVIGATVPANNTNTPCRIAIAGDYVYRSKFFTTNAISSNNVDAGFR